jgi:ABC-type transporter Mla maintaining outer membrane lipid asymmetry ATPase subunit MlaF
VSQIVIAHNYLHVLETCDRVCLLQNKELLTLVGVEYRDPGT